PGFDLGSAAPPHTHVITSDVDPDFSEPIKNVTVPVGREAILSCLVTELGHFKCYTSHVPRERNPVVLNREISGATRLVLPYQSNGQGKCCPKSRCTNCTLYACSLRRLWTIRCNVDFDPLALSSAESPFSQTIKSKNEKRIFVPSTDRIRNLEELLKNVSKLFFR
ncbi:hypothetical protein L9F63_009580, partial [Diploptera punctata]